MRDCCTEMEGLIAQALELARQVEGSGDMKPVMAGFNMKTLQDSLTVAGRVATYFWNNIKQTEKKPP